MCTYAMRSTRRRDELGLLWVRTACLLCFLRVTNVSDISRNHVIEKGEPQLGGRDSRIKYYSRQLILFLESWGGLYL